VLPGTRERMDSGIFFLVTGEGDELEQEKCCLPQFRWVCGSGRTCSAVTWHRQTGPTGKVHINQRPTKLAYAHVTLTLRLCLATLVFIALSLLVGRIDCGDLGRVFMRGLRVRVLIGFWGLRVGAGWVFCICRLGVGGDASLSSRLRQKTKVVASAAAAVSATAASSPSMTLDPGMPPVPVLISCSHHLLLLVLIPFLFLDQVSDLVSVTHKKFRIPRPIIGYLTL
jgi:hypothetical protein